MKTIEDWRKQINVVDQRLLNLLNERARLAQQIGRLKRKNGRRLWSPSRERAVLDRITQLNAGPLGRDAVHRLFRTIIRESRRSQAAAMRSLRTPS